LVNLAFRRKLTLIDQPPHLHSHEPQRLNAPAVFCAAVLITVLAAITVIYPQAALSWLKVAHFDTPKRFGW
jgi:hypothetical protein